MLKHISLAFTFLLSTANMVVAQSYQNDEQSSVLLKNGDTLTQYNRNDTIDVTDPVTAEVIRKYETTKIAVKLNDVPIYQYTQVKKPARKWLRGDVQKVLNRKLRREIEEAKNFFGHVELIINEEGEIVYNDINLYPTDLSGTTTKSVDKEKSDSIRNSISQKLSAMHFKPAKKDGKAVAYYAMFY